MNPLIAAFVFDFLLSVCCCLLLTLRAREEHSLECWPIWRKKEKEQEISFLLIQTQGYVVIFSVSSCCYSIVPSAGQREVSIIWFGVAVVGGIKTVNCIDRIIQPSNHWSTSNPNPIGGDIFLSMSTLEKYNQFLPEIERTFIAEDDALNLAEIIKCLDLLDAADVIEKELLERCFQSINSRSSLKYVTDEKLSTRVFNSFNRVLMDKVIEYTQWASLGASWLLQCFKLHYYFSG